METLGGLIARLRGDMNMTKSKLARALDVTPGAVSQWEGDATMPGRQNARKLDELLGGNGEILRRTGHATVAAPGDIGETLESLDAKLDQILAEIEAEPSRVELAQRLNVLTEQMVKMVQTVAAIDTTVKKVERTIRDVRATTRRVDQLVQSVEDRS